MSTSAPASAPQAPVPAPAPAAAATKTTKKKTVKKATGAGTTAKPKKKPRRKRPASSARSTPQNAQAVWNNAGIAQKDLEQQAALQAALRSDPLWYRTDDPLRSIDQDSFMAAGGSGVLTDQVELVEAALAANHLTRAEVTPQAYACLLEQARRYALELLADAQDYAYSANRYDISRADLVLAQEFRADQPLADFTQQPKLLHLAHQVNQKPLPPIPSTNYTGVVLPPKEHQLTARTFDVISGARIAQRMVAPAPSAPAASKTANPTPMQPSYGASRGRQIPIHIQTKEASNPAAPGGAAPAQQNNMPPSTSTASATGPPNPAAYQSVPGSMAPPRTVAPSAAGPGPYAPSGAK